MSTAPNLTPGAPASDDWTTVVEEIIPRQGEWTEEQYLALTDHTSRLVEFTDGCLEVLPMPTDYHQAILEFLFLAFREFINPRGGKARFAALRLRIGHGKFREPDLLLLRSAADERRQNRFWTGADLALEVVSPEKPQRDLVQKRAEYADAGVEEYWIVNPQSETITVLRLDAGAYAEVGCFRRGEQAASAMLVGFAVDVSAVFDAD